MEPFGMLKGRFYAKMRRMDIFNSELLQDAFV